MKKIKLKKKRTGKHQSHHNLATFCHGLITRAGGQQCSYPLTSKMLPAHGRLAGNSLFVRCLVTINQPMNALVVLRKLQLYNNFIYTPEYPMVTRGVWPVRLS